MSGGITDPPEKKEFKANFEHVIQGSTASELLEALKDLPPNATIVWVDTYERDERSIFEPMTPVVTVGIGFKWPASPTP